MDNKEKENKKILKKMNREKAKQEKKVKKEKSKKQKIYDYGIRIRTIEFS